MSKHPREFWFDSATRQENLKDKSIVGGLSTSAGQMINFVLNLGSTVVLARILLPGDFGLVGMVTAFTGFAAIIQDLGLSMAVIQKEKITHQEVTNLFWINILICICLGLLFVVCSPLIVRLYQNDTRLYAIIFAYALGIAVSGLSIQHTALVTRKMLFTGLAKFNILSTIISVLCGVAAALLGAGYWALIILNLSTSLFYTSFIWILCDWRPSLPFKGHSVRSYIRFGAGVSGSNIVNYFSQNTDKVLIGSRLGPDPVGLYTKAYQLLMLPINQLRIPLTIVAIPALSSLNHDALRFVNYFKKYIFILAFFSMPLVVCLGVFSEELILIILGNQWVESGKIFKILAFAAFIIPVSNARGMVLTAVGQTRRLLILVIIITAGTLLGIFIGIHWGVMGVALSVVISNYVLLVPTLLYAFDRTFLKVTDFFSEIALPVAHSLFILVVQVALKELLKGHIPDIVLPVILIPAGLVLYYFSWKAYGEAKRRIKDIDELLKTVLEKLGLQRFHLLPGMRSIKDDETNKMN